jgi:hypothetical protein
MKRYLGRPVAMVGDQVEYQRSSIYEETTFDVLKQWECTRSRPYQRYRSRLRAVKPFLISETEVSLHH